MREDLLRRLVVLRYRRIPWWRTHVRSVALRGSLRVALLFRPHYVRGARGLTIWSRFLQLP